MAQLLAQIIVPEALDALKKLLTPTQSKKMADATSAQKDLADQAQDLKSTVDSLTGFLQSLLPLAAPLHLLTSEIIAEALPGYIKDMQAMFDLLATPGGDTIVDSISSLIKMNLQLLRTLLDLIGQQRSFQKTMIGMDVLLIGATRTLKTIADTLFGYQADPNPQKTVYVHTGGVNTNGSTGHITADNWVLLGEPNPNITIAGQPETSGPNDPTRDKRGGPQGA